MIDFYPLESAYEPFDSYIDCPGGNYIPDPKGYTGSLFIKTGKYEGVWIIANGLYRVGVECEEQVIYPIDINWDTPTFRQGGAVLAASDIYTYQVCYSNIDVDVTECEQFRGVNSATLTVYDVGEWVISISTIDTDGIIGFSESYRVSI
jgi:hypothetical protein